jgi:hypothetical protein
MSDLDTGPPPGNLRPEADAANANGPRQPSAVDDPVRACGRDRSRDNFDALRDQWEPAAHRCAADVMALHRVAQLATEQTGKRPSEPTW